MLLVLLHYSPLAASAFNGFSAPQNRFEYLLALRSGSGGRRNDRTENIRRKEMIWSILLVLLVYIAVIWRKDLDLSLMQIGALLCFCS
ncbi:YfhO family protein [Bacillus licheniformis]|nr:YfhO family protein [Bacillus licheniformis]